MNTTQQLLQEAKDALQIQSDYGLAKAMGLSRQAVSHYQCGRRHLDTESAWRLAEVLKRDPALIIAAIEAEKATAPAAREVWIQRLKQLGGVAACITIVASGMLPTPAKSMTASHNDGIRAVHRPEITVFRSTRRRTRCRSYGLSRWFVGLFSRLDTPLFAAPAHA